MAEGRVAGRSRLALLLRIIRPGPRPPAKVCCFAEMGSCQSDEGVMLDSDRIRFRRLESGDLSLLHRWLNTPHVLRWWKEPLSPQEVVEKYTPRITGQAPTDSYLILSGDTVVGYIQTYRITRASGSQ
jgi:RimJ/RimL family protein N-acetyltransferase